MPDVPEITRWGREWQSVPKIIRKGRRKFSKGERDTLSLEIRIGCSVRGVANTGRSLTISPELSIRGVLEVTVGAGFTLELAVRV